MPFNPATWVNHSSRVFHGRSAGLQQIDQALAAYVQAKSGHTLKAVARAILAWQASKPGWSTSLRGLPMIDLINYVKVEAETQLPQATREIFAYVAGEPIITQLNSDPYKALQRLPAYVTGAPDGPTDFKVQRTSSADGTYIHDLLQPGIAVGAGYDRIVISPLARGPVWRAVAIAMHTDVDAHSNANHIIGKLHTLQGASSMTTGQLSGCAFIIREHNGHVECTHIKPNGFVDGVALQNHLERLYLGPGVVIWGRKQYPYQGGEVRAAIVGRRGPHGWQIYAQRYLHGTSHVLGVSRIWPA
ncbi:MAG: hypothetical protein R3F60_28615 [bacterium]